MKTIDARIKEYLELKSQKEKLEAQMSTISQEIALYLEDEKLDGATYTREV